MPLQDSNKLYQFLPPTLRQQFIKLVMVRSEFLLQFGRPICCNSFHEFHCLFDMDFGQSELNDTDAIYRRAQTRKISLIRVAAREEELCSGSILRRFPTGVSLIHRAKSLTAARRVMAEYLRAADAVHAA